MIIVNETEANGKGAVKPLMYYICDMQDKLDINQLCDDVLNRIYHTSGHQANALTVGLILTNLRVANILIAMNIIVSDGFADIIDGTGEYITVKLNHKGIAFYHTDTFVARAERWNIEKDIKVKELKKLNWEVSKLGVTYALAWSGVILSIIALIPNSTWHQLYAKLQQLFQ